MKPKFYISLVLSFSIIFSVQAAPPDSPETSSSTLLLSLENLAVPESLGKVERRFTGTSSRWVINIQDVHAHLTAQENIAAIIDHLGVVYGIKTVALEGGWSQTSFQESWGLPSSREKQMLARALLEDDQITGPAYSALFSPMPTQLVGIEDKELYAKNREIFLKHIASSKATQEKISVWAKQLATQKDSIFNAELKSFDTSLIQFREGKKAENFIPSLLSLAENKGADLSSFDQISLFKKVLSNSGALDKDKLQSEAERLVKAFERDRLNFEELLRSGKLSAQKLALYPEAKKYLELMKLQDQIAHIKFFMQIEAAITKVKEKLFTSQEQKDLDAKSERLVLAKKILKFQATPDDLKAYEAQKELVDSECSQANLKEAFDLGLSFYEIAKERDGIFFKKIKEEPTLSGNIAVVTGGFHTEGLSAQLEEAGISYMIITPALGDGKGNEELYFKRLQDNILSQTLSDMQNRFLTKPFDDGFKAGVLILRDEKNISKAVESVAQAITSGASPAAKETREAPEGAVSVSEFMQMAKETQIETVRKWLQVFQDSKLPIVIVIKTSALKELFQNPVALTLWKTIAEDRFYTVGEIRDIDEYLDPMIGTHGAQVLRIRLSKENKDVETILQKKFKRPLDEKRVAVIDGELKTSPALILPVDPVSFLLARLLLERGISGKPEPQFLNMLQDLLKEIFVKDNLLQTAA